MDESAAEELKRLKKEQRLLEKSISERETLKKQRGEIAEERKRLKKLEGELHPTKIQKLEKGLFAAAKELVKGGKEGVRQYKAIGVDIRKYEEQKKRSDKNLKKII